MTSPRRPIPDQAISITHEDDPAGAGCYYGVELNHPSGAAGLIEEIAPHYFTPGNHSDEERARQEAWADIHAIRSWLQAWGVA